jgi:hypothetical protein
MTSIEQPILSVKNKISLIAEECIGMPVQKYIPENENVFQGNKFNGCVAFIKFVLIGSGVPIPDFIGPDRVQRPINHVNEFFDHFGINVPYGNQQDGDLIFFSWDGNRPLHVGIVTNEDYYIHGHTKKGAVSKNKIAIYPIKTGVTNPVYTLNPIGFKRPTLATGNTRWFQKTI